MFHGAWWCLVVIARSLVVAYAALTVKLFVCLFLFVLQSIYDCSSVAYLNLADDPICVNKHSVVVM